MRTAGPIGRRIQAVLTQGKTGMLRQCADDTEVSLRSASLCSALLPPFRVAGCFAGIKLKPGKCEIVMVGARPDEIAQSEVRRLLQQFDMAWGHIKDRPDLQVPRHVSRTGGAWAQLGGPGREMEEPRELAHRGLLATAFARFYRQRALTVLSYVGALVEAPSNIAEAKRHLLAHLLHLRGRVVGILSSLQNGLGQTSAPSSRRWRPRLAAGLSARGRPGNVILCGPANCTTYSWQVHRHTTCDGPGCRWECSRRPPSKETPASVLHSGRLRGSIGRLRGCQGGGVVFAWSSERLRQCE